MPKSLPRALCNERARTQACRQAAFYARPDTRRNWRKGPHLRGPSVVGRREPWQKLHRVRPLHHGEAQEAPLPEVPQPHAAMGRSIPAIRHRLQILSAEGGTMIVLGIDIGVTGAIAILQDGELVNVHDMPCLDDGPVKRRNINAPLLASIIYSTHAELAYVEHVSARPKEGPTGAFAFGRSRGVIEGVLAAAGVPVQFLTPVS